MRYIEAATEALRLIDAYLQAAGHDQDLSEPLFRPVKNTTTTTLAKPLHPASVYRDVVRHYAAAAGLLDAVPGLCAHSLRRAPPPTPSTGMKPDIAKVQVWLGHADISTTRVCDNHISQPRDRQTFKVWCWAEEKGDVPWNVYILECADPYLYTGISNNLDRRVAEHATGKGARYTKGRGPFGWCTRDLPGQGGGLQARNHDKIHEPGEEAVAIFMKSICCHRLPFAFSLPSCVLSGITRRATEKKQIPRRCAGTPDRPVSAAARA